MKQPLLTLAPRVDGKPAAEIGASRQRLMIVGANGAGKTRFAMWLAEHTSGAYNISALRALFDVNYTDPAEGSIDSRWREMTAEMFAPSATTPQTTQAERLTALIMREEMRTLLSRKLAPQDDATPDATPLDRIISVWQQVFPENKILVEAGQLLVKHSSRPDRYSAMRMSAGERAVLYLIGAVLLAPPEAQIFIDSPEMFLHPSMTQHLWNLLEQTRPDCRYIYVTHNLDFVASRGGSVVVWVRSFDPALPAWDYQVIPPEAGISEEMYATILGARKPVMFIEGDGVHSIDAKLYPLIFREYTIKSLGSCNKVIEATRIFNDLQVYHQMDSCGIVDRDRRDEKEVEYLRGKRVMVPEVAEIENILMLEGVIRAVAENHGKNPTKVFLKVKKSVMQMFDHELRQQALLHTRHRVKRFVECRIDGRFTSINMLETHLRQLPDEINARGLYEQFCRSFRSYVAADDYAGVLKVYNQKSMLPGSNVAGLCGLRDKKDYVDSIIAILRRDGDGARKIREAVKRCFGLL